MQVRKGIICGLPAYGSKPPFHQQARQEAADDQGSDVEEITELEYRRSMGYLIRVEEDEEDIETEFRRVVQNLRKEEQRLRNQERNSASMKRPKQEQGESSRGKARRRD